MRSLAPVRTIQAPYPTRPIECIIPFAPGGPIDTAILAFVLGRMAEESFRQSFLLSHGHLDIRLTGPLATSLLVLAFAAMILPAVLPPVKRLLGTVGEETGT